MHSCTSFDVVQTNETLIDFDAIVEETEGGCAHENATGMEGNDSLVVEISGQQVSVHSESGVKCVIQFNVVPLTANFCFLI